jgi:integrase
VKTPPGIKKLANGKFQARYFAGFDANGKRTYPSQRFDRQSEAIEWLAKQKADKISGGKMAVSDSKLTIGEFVDQYLEMIVPTHREVTIKTWKNILTKHVKNNPLGRVKLAGVRPLHIEVWQAGLLKVLAISSVRTMRQVLSSMLVKARTLELISSDVSTMVLWPKARKVNRDALKLDQAREFLRRCDANDKSGGAVPFGLIYRFALAVGLRPEEYQALKWEDLELRSDGGSVKVQRVVQERVGGGWIWEEPKTERGKRRIQFDLELTRRLQEHRRRQLEWKLKAGPDWQNLNLVFPSELGMPISQDRLRNRFYEIMEEVGIEDLRLYDLRHAFVTFSLLAGIDPNTISYEAGHTNVAFTLDHYGHVLEEMKERSAAKRAALFAGI